MSESSGQRQRIYLALLDRGDDAWRAVDAVRLADDVFRITSVNPSPDERWEYATGQIVRCRTAILASGERVLVATQRVGGTPTAGPDVHE